MPAAVDGNPAAVTQAGNLACYAAKLAKRQPKAVKQVGRHVHDQIGELTLDVANPRELRLRALRMP